MKWKRKTIVTNNSGEAKPVAIVHDAAMANPEFGEGRLISLLILDTASRPDIIDLIAIHQNMPPGDVKVTWGKRFMSMKNILLLLQFERPAETTICIEFSVEKHGPVIDLILGSQAVYIQGGKVGDRLGSTMDEPRILVEIPDTGFSSVWNEAWISSLVKQYKRKGLSRKKAKNAALRHINSFREARRINVSPA
ncbi:MAG: hypothetical protein ABW118_16540 [Candidatus Thiodiazotropha sp.]